MFNNLKPIPEQWTYLLCRKFQKINNVCILCVKEKRYISRKNVLKIYGYCNHKSCKVFVIFIHQFTCNDANYHKVTVYSSSLNYNHIKPLTKYVKGVERDCKKRIRYYQGL